MCIGSHVVNGIAIFCDPVVVFAVTQVRSPSVPEEGSVVFFYAYSIDFIWLL